MPPAVAKLELPDVQARRRALLDHGTTLLVEAGAGSGKTSLMAGRVALILAAGVATRDIVAITFTEAAASELRERIEGIVERLERGDIPDELKIAVPDKLSAEQSAAITVAFEALDELTCTTIHGFCQQLVKPYPVEAGIDPGATIIDPEAADLAYQDLLQAWLSARFGRDRGAEGLGRLPPLPALGEQDFFAELLVSEPDHVIQRIQETAAFLRTTRTATAPPAAIEPGMLDALSAAIEAFATWYANCGLEEADTASIIGDLLQFKTLVDEASKSPRTGRSVAKLLLHVPPECKHGTEPRFVAYKKKGKWESAAAAKGRGKPHGAQLSAVAQACYDQCSSAYTAFVGAVAAKAFVQFVAEFEPLAKLYADYKRQAALLDFDDLLYHARDLLVRNEHVRQALSRRYPRILVDEFQDTDPLQAEILWRLCGEGDQAAAWVERKLRPGCLFVVGDPKQAIYRFRGADVDTYLEAKRAILAQDPDSVLEIVANFRSLKQIIDFTNDQFKGLLSPENGQPGFTALQATRHPPDERPAVACFEVTLGDAHKNNKGNLVVDRVRHEESRVVADLVSRLIGTYQVWDKRAKAMRPCRAGDIALLAPTGTSLWIYERELERREISIASQAGKSFYTRQEVQDMIAVARAIADRRDTLALGALLRGPLVGLTEEEIADAIIALPPIREGQIPRLHLWTDCQAMANSVLKRTFEVLQNLARRARQTTPYHLMAEAIEELNVRPILRARYRQSAERALANVEMVLEMARAYETRGLVAFADALRGNWEDSQKHIEGRPDADAEAVSISTMHSAKGLEWPIVIPINSPTQLDESMDFLHRRSDNTVHFKLMGSTGPDYDLVKAEEQEQLRRERVRLWYVALTRACDLLLLPRHNERLPNDWFSLLSADMAPLPAFDVTAVAEQARAVVEEAVNGQDQAKWETEAAAIAAMQRSVVWRSPSRHDGRDSKEPELADEGVFVGEGALSDTIPAEIWRDDEQIIVKGGRERGLLVHKLVEEVLTGETGETAEVLETRARTLISELGVAEADRAEDGLHAPELAASVRRALSVPQVAELRPRLVPEMTVFSAEQAEQGTVYVGGVADALALDGGNNVDVVIDWKSDVEPTVAVVDMYREQVRDYLAATGAKEGLVVFVTSGRVERVLPR
ncbi:MAG: UvrD-helicase domain-containing protein [Rhizomicrobium sp.]|jgi:exodeoxyribonuclease-5